jgi:peptide/nickel transport system substrate-binding protein
VIARRAFAACVVLALAATACTRLASGTEGRSNSFTIPHVLRIAMDEDVPTLNPWFSSTMAVNSVAEMTMAYLFRYNRQNQPQPELATLSPTRLNGGISRDGKTITYHLRKGVRWSDGVPFSADDVVFSFKQYLNKRNNVGDLTGWRLIKAISEPDRATVKIRLSEPYSPFESTFFGNSGACILPKHLLGSYKELNDVPYNAMPVGIGPFRVERWKRAEEITLLPNDLYWRGRPKLQRIAFRVITSRTTVLQQLQTGDLDLWIPAPAYFIDRLRGLQGYSVTMQPSYGFSHIDFNLSHPALADARVRRALRLATNRRLLIQKISHGIGVLQESPLSLTYPNAPPVIPAIGFDRDTAAALLDEAGWSVGPNGVRQKKGRELRLQVAMGAPEVDADSMMELIRGWWQDIGVAIDVRHYDTKLFFGQFSEGGIINTGHYDVTLFTWQMNPFDSMYSIFGCNAFPPEGQNNTRYCNREADRLMNRYTATYDPVEQRALQGRLLKILARDVPMFVTAVRENIWVANRDLKNFAPGPSSAFSDMQNVDI